MSKFYVVSSAILPDVLEKVMEAQTLLQTGQVRKISEAVKKLEFPEERSINTEMQFSPFMKKIQDEKRF